MRPEQPLLDDRYSCSSTVSVAGLFLDAVVSAVHHNMDCCPHTFGSDPPGPFAAEVVERVPFVTPKAGLDLDLDQQVWVWVEKMSHPAERDLEQDKQQERVQLPGTQPHSVGNAAALRVLQQSALALEELGEQRMDQRIQWKTLGQEQPWPHCRSSEPPTETAFAAGCGQELDAVVVVAAADSLHIQHTDSIAGLKLQVVVVVVEAAAEDRLTQASYC